VAARRIESALRVWRDALAPRARRRARRRLRRWRRQLSGVRDLEVLHEALDADGLSATPAETACLSQLAAAIAGRRDRGRRRAAARFTDARLERLRRLLERAVVNARFDAAAVAAAAHRRARVDLDAESVLASLADTDDDGKLHAARIAVKKRRYAGEVFVRVAGGAADDATAAARALQRALGAVHDRAALRDRLQEFARRAIVRRRPERATALLAVSARVERLRLEALARFRSLRLTTVAAG